MTLRTNYYQTSSTNRFCGACSRKLGVLFTGIDDDKIQPEGSPNYKVYPPTPLDPAAAAPVSNKIDPVKNDCQSIQPKDDEVQPGEQVKLKIMSMTVHWTHLSLVRRSIACMKMAGLKERFYTLILKFVNITFCLLTEPQTML